MAEHVRGFLDDLPQDSLGPTWQAMLVLTLANCADAIEVGVISYVLLALQLTEFERSFLSAAVFFGMLVGGVAAGAAADRVGRLPTLRLSLAVTSLFQIACAFARSPWELIVLRLLGGVGVGGTVPAIFALCAEISPSPVRGRMINIVALGYLIGSVFIALVAWCVMGRAAQSATWPLDSSGSIDLGRRDQGWRLLLLLAAAPAALSLVLTGRYVPESPPFLAGRGRMRETVQALRALVRHTAIEAVVATPECETLNGDNSVLHCHFRALVSLAEEEPSQRRGASVISAMPQSATTRCFDVSFLRRSAVRRPFVCLCIVWWTISFSFYGMNSWMPLLFQKIGQSRELGVFGQSLFFQMGQLPGNVGALILVNVMGRRWLLAVALLGTTVASLGLGFASSSTPPSRPGILAAAVLFNVFSSCAWNTLDCLSAECFPTAVRSSVMGTLTAIGRVASIAAQFVNGALLNTDLFELLLVTCACSLIGAAATLCVPREASEREKIDGDVLDAGTDATVSTVTPLLRQQ